MVVLLGEKQVGRTMVNTMKKSYHLNEISIYFGVKDGFGVKGRIQRR